GVEGGMEGGARSGPQLTTIRGRPVPLPRTSYQIFPPGPSNVFPGGSAANAEPTGAPMTAATSNASRMRICPSPGAEAYPKGFPEVSENSQSAFGLCGGPSLFIEVSAVYFNCLEVSPEPGTRAQTTGALREALAGRTPSALGAGV